MLHNTKIVEIPFTKCPPINHGLLAISVTTVLIIKTLRQTSLVRILQLVQKSEAVFISHIDKKIWLILIGRCECARKALHPSGPIARNTSNWVST
jgi:hypothetical protein